MQFYTYTPKGQAVVGFVIIYVIYVWAIWPTIGSEPIHFASTQTPRVKYSLTSGRSTTKYNPLNPVFHNKQICQICQTWQI